MESNKQRGLNWTNQQNIENYVNTELQERATQAFSPARKNNRINSRFDKF